MRRVIAILGLVATAALPLAAAGELVKFEGGIGVIPVSRFDVATQTVVRNVVRGVPPGGQPWVIDRLTASVFEDGRINVDGRGLLLAGGDAVGKSNSLSVRAKLFCGAESFNSDLVQLDAAGDFRIDGRLDPPPPAVCDNPALLIVSSGGAWFAAGIPKH